MVDNTHELISRHIRIMLINIYSYSLRTSVCSKKNKFEIDVFLSIVRSKGTEPLAGPAPLQPLVAGSTEF